MKNTVFILVLGVLVQSLMGCSNRDADKKSIEKKKCNYSYNDESSVLEWTAFKFNNKTPVKGTFTKVNINGLKTSNDPKELLKSLRFSILTASVETQNVERNAKIVQFFFGTIKTDSIVGKVLSLDDSGKSVVKIKMNGIDRDVEGDYTFIDNKFTFKSSIDVAKWNALSGIDALNTVCKVLHTGNDGVSKLWTTVDIQFSTTLKADCQ
jgi:hypothetical protein